MKKVFLGLVLMFVIFTGCKVSQTSSDEGNGPLGSGNTEVAPSQSVRFGGGEWHDVGCLLSKDNSFVGYSNQKYSGTAEITILATYDQEQIFDIERYKRQDDPDNEPYNQGDWAEINAVELTNDQVNDILTEDGIDIALGSHNYLIRISAPDKGYHAYYTVTMNTPVKAAIAMAVLDDPALTRASFNVPATYSKNDTAVTC